MAVPRLASLARDPASAEVLSFGLGKVEGTPSFFSAEEDPTDAHPSIKYHLGAAAETTAQLGSSAPSPRVEVASRCPWHERMSTLPTEGVVELTQLFAARNFVNAITGALRRLRRGETRHHRGERQAASPCSSPEPSLRREQ